jgi:ABC-type multidrug transport system fused ATPase/permease subunit
LVAGLEAIRPGRTIIVIAHRRASVQDCDCIFEFEDGRVVRSGSFSDLSRASPRFRRMMDVER